MSENRNVTYGGGCLLPTLLGTLFVGLKLTNHIDWSWFWVLAPFWIATLISIAIIAAVVAFMLWAEYSK